MFDPFVQKAFDKIKDAGLAPVYGEEINLLGKHINFVETQLEDAKEKLAEYKYQFKIQEEELARLLEEVASFDGKAKLVDIGPCFIKEDKAGERLEGFYCSVCHTVMERRTYYGHKREHTELCQKCNIEILAVVASLVDTAFSAYQKKRGQTHSS